jgi:hypothetical protein
MIPGVVSVVSGLVMLCLMQIPGPRLSPGDIWFPGPLEICGAIGVPAVNVLSALCAVISGVRLAMDTSKSREARRRGVWATAFGIAGPLLWIVPLKLNLTGYLA